MTVGVNSVNPNSNNHGWAANVGVRCAYLNPSSSFHSAQYAHAIAPYAGYAG